MIEFFIRRYVNQIAKNVRKAFREIPFYRRKLKKFGIPESEVDKISSVEELDKFLSKYPYPYVTSEDLINKDYSLNLSFVPQEKRIWIQTSSGYEGLVDFIKGIELKRKSVAYTREDLKKVSELIYQRGLMELPLPEKPANIGIFARLGDMCGSGAYPFIGISGNYAKIPARTLYFGYPSNDLQLFQWMLEAKNLGIDGIITVPSVIDRMVKIAEEKRFKFSSFTFLAYGGDRLLPSFFSKVHQLGAEAIISGYSVQEAFPLGGIGWGVVSSESSKIEETDGIIITPGLCRVRITDEKGENVSIGERGYVKITSVFEGTSLIDYFPGDVAKLIDNEAEINWKGRKIKIPSPVIDFDISRAKEYSIRIQERTIPTNVLVDVCGEVSGYNFLIFHNTNQISIVFPFSVRKKIYQFKQKLSLLVPQEVYERMRICLAKDEFIRKMVFPLNHHKPHNLYELERKFEEELYEV